jgi:hypothetical protein
MKKRIFIYTIFLVILSLTSCASKKIITCKSVSPNDNIIGSYRIEDSIKFASPLFMFNVNDEVDRATPMAGKLHIDSLSNKQMFCRYEKDSIVQNFIVKIRKTKKKIIVKPKISFRTYVIVSAIGRSKVDMLLTDENNLIISKSNYGLGFILVAPGFAASEGFSYEYHKL